LLEVTTGTIGTTENPGTNKVTGGNILVSDGTFKSPPTSDGTTEVNKIEISGATLPSGEVMEIDIDGTKYKGVVSDTGDLTIYLPASATGKEVTVTGGGKTFEGTIGSGGLILTEAAPAPVPTPTPTTPGDLTTKSVPAYQAFFGMWFSAAMEKIEQTTGWTFPDDMTINVKFDDLDDDVVATCGMPPTLSGQKTKEITITFNTDFFDADKPITEVDGKIEGNRFPSDTVLAHELVHGLMYANIPADVVVTIPAWFTEGLAEAAVGNNRFRDFDPTLTTTAGGMNMVQYAHDEVRKMTNATTSDGSYTGGYLFMSWLDNSDGDGSHKIQDLVAELETAASFDAAMLTVFSANSDDMLSMFKAEETAAYAASGSGSNFAPYNTWLADKAGIQSDDGKESDALAGIDSTISDSVKEAKLNLATLVDDVVRIQHNGKNVTFKWDLASAGVAAKQTKVIPPEGVSFAPNSWVKLKANGTEQEVQTDSKGELILDAFGSGEVEIELEHNGVTYKATFTIGDETLDFNQRDEVPADPGDPGTTASGGLVLQIGANGSADQRISVFIEDMSAAGLGIESLSVATIESANKAIDLVDNAVHLVSAQRASLGAVQNRLQSTLNSLGVSIENLSSAESVIRDTDMAKAMMNFTKHNIMQQAAQAMLAQANGLPEGVLQLLR
jgi:flagellin-like hook-associated protein FlgL